MAGREPVRSSMAGHEIEGDARYPTHVKKSLTRAKEIEHDGIVLLAKLKRVENQLGLPFSAREMPGVLVSISTPLSIF